MKNILLLIVVCLGNMWTLKAQGHPVIYASASDKETIQQKIADENGQKKRLIKYAEMLRNMQIAMLQILNGLFHVLPCIGKRVNDILMLFKKSELG